MSDAPVSSPKPLRFRTIAFVVSVLATLMVAWAVEGQKKYGFGLFLGVPLAIGLMTALLYHRGRVWRWGEVAGLSLANLGLCAVWVLLCRIEGVVCLLMAAFLVAAVTLVGILISWAVQGYRGRRQFHAIILFAVPVLMHWEASAPADPEVMELTSVMEVDAPAEIVWQFIPAFPEIETPPSGWLATGLAYPIRAEMDGDGLGAIRRCVLSTGAMPERVTVWEVGRRLEFDVLSTPPSMVETNPFGEVHAAHTDGYFQSKRGRFVLTPLPGGRTRVAGTSWFTQDLQPAWYWDPITRHTVSQVHRRVLEHVKKLAEKSARERSL